MNTSHISQPENYKTNNWKMRRQPTPAAAMSYNIVLHYKTCHINKLYSSSRTQNLKYFKNQTSLRYVLNIRLSLKIFINFIVSDIGGCWLTDFGLAMKVTLNWNFQLHWDVKISNIKKFFFRLFTKKKIMKKTPHLLIRLCLSCVVCLYWYNNEIEFTTKFMADNLSSVYGSPIYILVLNCNIESTEKSSDGYQQPNICRKKGKLWQFMFWLFTERT